MGYFDLVKKKNEKLAPEYQQQSSITSNEGVAMRGVENIQQPTITQTVGASGADAHQGAGQKMEEASNLAHGMSANPTAAERIQAGQDPFKVLLDRNYQQSEESIKRQRAADVLGGLAQVFGQSIASAAGARQFTPVKTNTAYYNSALDKLREGYNNTLANYTLSQAKQDAANKAAQAQLEFKFAQDAALAKLKNQLDAGLIDKRTANNMQLEILKAKNAEQLAKTNFGYDVALQKQRDAAAGARTKASNDAAMARKVYEVENKGDSGKDSDYSSIRVKNPDGTYETIRYKKSYKGAITSLYNKMKDIAESNPERYGDVVEKMDLKFGEGGTREDKALSIIATRIQDFPELADEFREIIGQEKDNTWSLKEDDSNNGWSLK